MNENTNDNAEVAIAEAAIKVMNAIQALSPEQRSRVLHSVAALYGVLPLTSSPVASSKHAESGMGSFSSPDLAASATTNPIKRLSIVEFLQQRQAVTNPQRIACFAHYREKIEGFEKFSKADLIEYFPQAKLPAPGNNYSRDYNNAIKEGWIHDEGSKSYLTQKGESAVDTGFGGKGKPRGAAAGKKRRGGKAGKAE